MHVNATGRFVIGGPMGDAGLTGRKIIVDTYGGMARHGGGAFSGKDPTKGGPLARTRRGWVAKNVVAAGLADRFELELAYTIGVARPVSVSIETYGTEKVSDEKILAADREAFRPAPCAHHRGSRPAPADLTSPLPPTATLAGPTTTSRGADKQGGPRWPTSAESPSRLRSGAKRPVYAVVLAGGSGTRLWPLSRPDRRKPFLKLLGDETLIQRTVARLYRSFAAGCLRHCGTAPLAAGR